LLLEFFLFFADVFRFIRWLIFLAETLHKNVSGREGEAKEVSDIGIVPFVLRYLFVAGYFVPINL